MIDPRDAWLAEALRSDAQDGKPRADCPDPEHIWRATQGELSVEELGVVLDHLAECPACTEAWSLARDFAGVQAPLGAAIAAHPPRTISHRLAWSWGIAAAAALVIATVAIPRLAPLYRGSAEPSAREPALPSLQPLTPDGASYPRDDVRLRWTAGPQGSKYEVNVTTEAGRVIVSEPGLDATEYRVPPERLAGIPSGTTLLWRVVALTPEGRPVSSPTVGVSVR